MVRSCLLLILAGMLSACSLQPAPQTGPTPTVSASPSAEPSPTAEATPAPTATPRPTATPPPTPTLPAPQLLHDPQQGGPIIALEKLDSSWQFLPLAREGGLLDLLPLRSSQYVTTTLRGEPLGWSFDGQLFAFLNPGTGNVDVLAPTLSISTTLITATVERRPIAGTWLSTMPIFTYLNATDTGLDVRAWRLGQPDVAVASLPGTRLIGTSALSSSPLVFDPYIALPLLRNAGAEPRRELVVVNVTEGTTVTLGVADGVGPLTAVWGPRGQLAFSAGAVIGLAAPEKRWDLAALETIGEGLPQDWGPDGLLIVDPEGHLLRWRAETGAVPVLAGGEPVLVDYRPKAARWVGRGEAVVLREDKLYQLTIP